MQSNGSPPTPGWSPTRPAPHLPQGLAGHRGCSPYLRARQISVPSHDGREIVLNLVGANDIFGEIALLDGEAAHRRCDRRHPLPAPRPRSARLHHRPAEEPAFAIKLLELVSQRLRRTSEQVEDLTFSDLPTRLAKAILRLSPTCRVSAARRARIVVTQKELGRTIGFSRESTNKCLRDWEEAGHIDPREGRLHDPQPGVPDRPRGECGPRGRRRRGAAFLNRSGRAPSPAPGPPATGLTWESDMRVSSRPRTPLVPPAGAVLLAALVMVGATESASSRCQDGPRPGVDWSGCGKAQLMLGGSDLSGAVFTKASLSSGDFTSAVLKGAKLVEAELSRTRFDGADAAGADFRARSAGAPVSRAPAWRRPRLRGRT